MKKKFTVSLLVLASLVLVFIGPWPVDDTHYSNTNYATKTFQRIKEVTPETESGQLLAGAAKVEITPSIGVPLGGNAARDPKENTGVLEKVYARAISISNGKSTVTILSPEFLLPLPELVNEVLRKTKLQREEIYFSATHTHSGPGSYAQGIIAEQTLGHFSKEYFQQLTDKLTQAILNSRQSMQPASLHYSRLHISPEVISNYLHDQLGDKTTTHNSLHLLQIKNTDSNQGIANLITFSMHPTILGRTNRKVSGDYPSVIMNNLERKLGEISVFTIGAPGGIVPAIKSNDATELNKRNRLGAQLSQLIATALTAPQKNNEIESSIQNWSASDIILQSEIIHVDLPASNYHISENWRLSPYLVQMIFHNKESYVHALRIGKLFFLSYPADFSGILAKKLEVWGDEKGIYPWINSFNGDYIGYIMPSEYEGMDNYVMRDVNFYGPWAGDYFMDISQRIMQRLNAIQ